MTHIWGVWQKIVTVENCRVAVRKEAQTKRCKRNGFALDLILREDYWTKYVLDRIAGGLRLGRFVEFDTMEHGKLRHVRCYEPQDAMCVRACVQQMEPRAYARMSRHSYCPVPDRGGLLLATELSRRIRRAENVCRIWNKGHPNARNKWRAWVSEYDMAGYYESLGYGLMRDTMWRLFGEPEVRNLIEVFLGQRDGLPIGAGYSAMIANMVLAPMDALVEGHKGCLGYARHLDNSAYITKAKGAAHEIREAVEEWCAERGLAAHEWAHYPAGHHAVERGGWRIEDDRILPGRKVMRHIERLMSRKWDELDYRQMLALASLYGYIKNSDAQGLKRRWRDGKYSQIFRAVGITAKEAEGGVLTINPEQERNTP